MLQQIGLGMGMEISVSTSSKSTALQCYIRQKDKNTKTQKDKTQKDKKTKRQKGKKTKGQRERVKNCDGRAVLFICILLNPISERLTGRQASSNPPLLVGLPARRT